jgi:type II secretory pathway pseudopilin PulG
MRSIHILGLALLVGTLSSVAPVTADAQVTANIDVNQAINQQINQATTLLQNLGIQPSGSIKETNDYWCIFNNWSDRDNYARAHGTFDNGRFSTGTTFGGRWYCTVKAG